MPVPSELYDVCPSGVLEPGPDDAVGGVAPAYVAHPGDAGEVATVLRSAAALGMTTVARGAGTKLDWGAAPERVDLLLDLSGMAAVIEHVVEDLVVRVQAGCPLSGLQHVLNEAGQRLPLDEVVEGSTVGGVVATGICGPLRHRYGGVRDVVLGVSFVRADGVAAKSGSKVVKNVAGYDLAKLLTGSFGTLGVLTEVIFRVRPRPHHEALLLSKLDGPRELGERLMALGRSDSAPSAVEVFRDGIGPVEVAVLLEGAAALDDRIAQVTSILGSTTLSSARPPWWGRLPGPTTVKVAVPRRSVPDVLGVADLLGPPGAPGIAPRGSPVVSGSAGVGVLYVGLAPETTTDGARGAARRAPPTLRRNRRERGRPARPGGDPRGTRPVGSGRWPHAHAPRQGGVRPRSAPLPGAIRRRHLMTSPGRSLISTELLSACVHCGFCLPTCPTYLLDGEEADSPRGRIQLMATMASGAPADDATARHLDRCLSCMACVSACPSGVRYDELIESARVELEQSRRRPVGERLVRASIFALFPHPRRLRLVRAALRLGERLGLRSLLRRPHIADRLPPLLQTLESLAPATAGAETSDTATRRAVGPARGRVGLLQGCVQGSFFPEVNAATARVLAAEGFDVASSAVAGCCGALSEHAGRRNEAMGFARRLIDAFPADLDAIVVNAAGCGSTLKAYGRLLGDDPVYATRAAVFAARVVDVAEFLARIEPRAERHRLPLVVAYQDACHLRHAQGIREQPRQLLGAIPGLELIELREPDICCGSAGIYNLLQPEYAARLGDRKAASVASSGADVLVSGNPGCLMQIRAALRRGGRAIAAFHTIEVLDASIRDAGAASLADPAS